MNSPDDPRLESLQRYADGVATPADLAAIEAAVKNDPAFRATVAEYLSIDSALGDALAVSAAAPTVAETNPATMIRPPAAVFRRTWLFAAAACAALLLVGAWSWRQVANPVRATVAQARGDAPLHTGDVIRGETVRLERGTLELAAARGLKITLTAPAEFRFVSEMLVRLERGSVTVDAGEHGKGFAIDTPRGRVVDLGTRFGVNAVADGATEVVVFSGKVDWHEGGATGPATRLGEGEAIRDDLAGGPVRLGNVFAARDGAGWSSQRQPEGVIAAVQDNLAQPDTHWYYLIEPAGMKADAPAWLQPKFRWQADTGRAFPSWLHGADLARMVQWPEVRLNPGLAITVTLARPATLYVLHDTRQPPPRWLAETFRDTGEALLLQEYQWHRELPPEQWRPLDRPRLRFEIYARDVPAGDITLGAPRDPESGSRGYVYGLAAKAR